MQVPGMGSHFSCGTHAMINFLTYTQTTLISCGQPHHPRIPHTDKLIPNTSQTIHKSKQTNILIYIPSQVMACVMIITVVASVNPMGSTGTKFTHKQILSKF